MSDFVTLYGTKLRRWLGDTEVTYSYSDTEVKSWINQAVQRCARETPYLEGSATLTTDGIKYYFDLSGLSSFWTVRCVSVADITGRIITEHPKGIAYIRQCLIANAIVAGTPHHYIIQALQIFFDRIQAASPKITVDYWKKPATLVLDAATPEGDLNDWDDYVTGMAALIAGADIGGEKGDLIKARGILTVYGDPRNGFEGEQSKFQGFVERRGHHKESVGIQYSELGDETVASDVEYNTDPYPSGSYDIN